MKPKNQGSADRRRIEERFAAAMARHRAGDINAATRIYEEILRTAPRYANAVHFLGLAQRQRGNLAEAARLMADSIAIDPGVPAYFGNFASLCTELGWTARALECYRRLTALNPGHAATLFERGRLALIEGFADEAANALGEAAACAGNDSAILFAIGELQHEGGFLDAALATLGRACALDPRNANGLNHLGGVLAALGRHDEAIRAYTQAIALTPGLVAARNNLGLALAATHRYADAEGAFRGAIAIDPGYARAWSNLGTAQKSGGQVDAAIASYRRALELDPRYAKAFHNLLFALNASDRHRAADLAAEHRAFGLRFEPSATPAARSAAGATPDRRLRVGYVSGDLRKHPVGFFLEAIFAHHDPMQLELFCYSTGEIADELSLALRSRVQGWRDCARLDDDRLAETIRADRIDILVDLAGHTEHNRLLLFARRPAPVQASYLGYANTTGMKSIDFRITDGFADPPGSEPLSSERLIRLPHSYYCYQPRPEAPPVVQLPAFANGFVTFGCCLNYAKASPTTHRLWAAVLQAVPESRLVLRASGFTDPAVRQRAESQFAALGIPASRLELLPHSPFPRHLETWNRIDIGLDTFPFNLATNLVEGLWQGVPCVSLSGSTSPSRMGLSILTAAGLPELATTDEAEFVAIAANLAADLESLAQMRLSMRQRLSASPLLDGAAKARDLAAAYREMWRQAGHAAA